MAAIQAKPAALQRAAPAHEIKSVWLPTRVTLPYVEQGDAAGVPVVFLHGVTDSWRSWEPVLAHVPSTIRGFALSQRGHGDADRPATGYRFEDFAADLTAFLDAMGIGPAVIAGHSLGSYVAQRFAMDHPERILGLVLVGSATTWQGNVAVAELWESVVSTLADPVDPAFVRAFQESPLLSRALTDIVVAESLKAPARVWRSAFQAILESDFSPELGKIQAPTLIVWGGQDPLCPRADQDALAAAIVGARLVVYPQAGHNLHWEEPASFAADLVAFVEGISD